MPKKSLIEPLKSYIDQVISEFDQIGDQRRALLTKIATKIQRTDQLIFICTHNSRRSHLCQVWSKIAAFYHQLDQIEIFSGGTSATACNIRTINALRRSGFLICEPIKSNNPIYRIRYSQKMPFITVFSKVYNMDNNPTENFVGLMCCPEADQDCPVVYGAKKRFSLHYVDPKFSDDTPLESSTYDRCCRQIASEMFFFIRKIIDHLGT